MHLAGVDRSKRLTTKAAGEKYRRRTLTRRSILFQTGCSKSSSGKAATDGRAGGVAPGYLEDDTEESMTLAGFFSSLSEVPGEASHNKPWIPRHEMGIRDTSRFIA